VRSGGNNRFITTRPLQSEHEIADQLDLLSKGRAGLHREMFGNGAKDDGRKEDEGAQTPQG
jgi:hypothetical protein